MLKIDLHMHTNYLQEPETNYSPKKLIDHAVSSGFDAIAITEHYFVINGPENYKKDPLKTYLDFKNYAQQKGILLIPGVELRFEEGEVVLFNFKGDVKKIKCLQDIKNLPESVLRIAPHPFYIKKICLGKDLEPNINLLDAIECSHFYSNFINRNKLAAKIARKYGKPLLGTSDAHRLYQIGHTYTLVDSEKNPDAIVKSIKSGKYKLKTKPLSPYLFLKIAFWSLIASFLKYRLYKIKQALSK